jgi:hypothetical protein
MGKSTGAVLVLAGLAVGAYALTSRPGQRDAATPVGTVAATSTAAVGGLERQAAHGGDTAPSHDPAASLPAPLPAKSEASAPQVRPLPTLLAPPPAASSIQRLRRDAPPTLRLAEAPPRVPVGETGTAAPPPKDHAGLARQIQRELKRIGCYQGDVSGVWTPSVRRAMKAAAERANASLPVDRPDAVLLALAQGQAAGACSEACPAGQERAAGGRCLPAALVARAAGHTGKERTPGATASTAPAGTDPNGGDRPATGAPTAAYRPMESEGRMSLAGPTAASVPRTTHTPAAAFAPKAGSRQARVATRPRAAGYARPRQRAAQRQPSSGYSGLPSWATFFMLP